MSVSVELYEALECFRTGDYIGAHDHVDQAFKEFHAFEKHVQTPVWAKEFIAFSKEEVDKGAAAISLHEGLDWKHADEEDQDWYRLSFDLCMAAILGERSRPIVINEESDDS